MANKRILGDQRIFQAVFNDLKLEHVLRDEVVDGRWVYVYDNIDPYELGDKAFPGTVAAIEAYANERVLGELIKIRDEQGGHHPEELCCELCDRIDELTKERGDSSE